ncbi:TonB family protein [Pelagicoccus sp. SDUM812005]|uniref:TonB family protein n=1 Tax=Pelagicoccus sp. SDUM812005 TaxID=3041257 RepID=UPI00280EB6CD|nr:TonB family protein [Pelagicoccus sp. SDUM812005]MDQ8179129.1 TonB family protein [Pelagicoccus sp. SDUM812005]
MYYTKFLLLSLILSLLKIESLGAAPITFYHFVNQRAYEVDSTEDGFPVLDKEVDASGIEYDGSLHNSWWFDGELPLKREVASALVDYTLKRLPQPYGQRDAEREYSLSVSWEIVMPTAPLSRPKVGDWLVLGWVHEGQVRRMQPARLAKGGAVELFHNSKFLVPGRMKAGYAALWQVRDGALLEKSKACSWDWIIEEGEVAAGELELLEIDGKGRDELFYAAANGRADRLARMLEGKKKLVKSMDEYEQLPLRYAAVTGRTEVAALFMEAKSPLEDGWGALNSIVMLAATHGHFETLKALVPAKLKGPTGSWHCSWAASEALNENYEDIVNYLMPFKPKINYDGVETERVVLNKIMQGYPELGFSMMERYKIDPSFDVDGLTALHSVAGYADASLLQKVAAFGLDPRAKSGKGLEPLDLALGQGNVDAICWFIDRREGELDEKSLARSIAQAIRAGRYSSIECLLGYGYDVNLELADGVTPLLFAIVEREFEIARLLLKHGGTLDPTGRYGSTLLARVVEGDELELLKVLMERGLDWGQLVFDDLSIRSAAEALEAHRILAYLEEHGIDAGSGGTVRPAGELEVRPQLLTPIVVEYPDDLRARFGSRTEKVEILVSKQGVPLFVRPENEALPEELWDVIEPAVGKLRFAPFVEDGEAVSVSLRTKLPLRADFELEKVYEIGDLDEKPKATLMSTPLYPYAMQQSRTEGRVVVEFVLMPNGRVRDAKPVKSTHEAFEAPAVRCVVQTVWEPALKDGRPVACRVKIPILFAP